MNQTERRKFLLAASALLVAPLAEAQKEEKIVRIGFLSAQTRAVDSGRIEAFRGGLREVGYVEGRNIRIDFVWAEGRYDRLPALATEFVRKKVDIIVAVGTPAILAARQATRTIPIVFPLSGDPIRTGVVSSLARPGENVTGLTTLTGELSRKRLELLREIVPGLSRVIVVSNPDNPVHGFAWNDLKEAAGALGLELLKVEVKSPDGFESALSTVGKARSQALFFLPDEMFNTQQKRVAALVIEKRLPASFYAGEWIDAGGLMFYGANINDQFRRAAFFVDKILKGSKPGDLPIEQPTKFELIINAKTAKAIGLTIPKPLLARADRVVE